MEVNKDPREWVSLSHRLAPFACLPLHGLIEHELHGRVEDQDEGGQHTAPQSAHALVGYDPVKGIWAGEGRKRDLFIPDGNFRWHYYYLTIHDTYNVMIVLKLHSTEDAGVLGLPEILVSELGPL